MNGFPEAVTFDFHNTLARCDQWFELEVRQLVPEFLKWHASVNGMTPNAIEPDVAISAYRRIRLEIMDSGLEKDAATCVDLVTRELGLTLDRVTIETGVEAVMRETLHGSDPIPGVVDAVRRLRALNIKLGVVSSAAYHPFLIWSLDKFGILDQFDDIVTSASCGFYKSRTEIYSIALERLDARPDRSVHIGDSERFDIATPAKLGMRTVLFDAPRSEDSSNADVVVESLCGVDEIVLGLGKGSPA